MRQIIYKWREFKTVATLPRGGRLTKMTAKAQRRLVSEVRRNPRVSAKDLQQSLAHANISVHTSAIGQSLNKNGVHRRTPLRFLCGVVLSEEFSLLTKKNIAARRKSPRCSTAVLAKHSLDRFLEGTHNAMCGGRMAQHTSIKTSSQL